MKQVQTTMLARLIAPLLLAAFFAATQPTLAQEPAPDSKSSAPASADPSAFLPSELKTTSPSMRDYREDLNSIRLDSSNLIPSEPLLGTRYDLPGNDFVRDLYQVAWRPNDPLDLYIVRPKGVKKPPVILYLYSFRSDTERFKNDGWCSRVTHGGYAAVGFVSALSGQRFHDRPMKEWFVSELQEALAMSTHDVQMILNYLGTRDDLDMSRVGMLGQGSGGAIAILAAAADPRIKAIELLDPWGDWPDWLAKSTLVPQAERDKYLKPDFLAQVKNLEPVNWLPRVKSRIHIQDVRGAVGVPEECQKKIEAAAPESAEIDEYGDARAFYREASGGRVFDWIESQLSPKSEPHADAPENRHRVYPPLGDNPMVGTAATH